MNDEPPGLEFSYPVEVSNLPSGGRHYKFSASHEECADVAIRLGLKKISSLKVFVLLTNSIGKLVNAVGFVQAEIVQSCVVTLAPISSKLFEEISIAFLKDSAEVAAKNHGGVEDLILLNEDDPPELAENGRIDLGEMAVAQLILALDPYPRADGVNFDTKTWGPREDDEASYRGKSFAALEKLKNIKQN